MQKLLTFLRHRWGALVVLLCLGAGAVAYATNAFVRDRTEIAWHAALSWAGVAEPPIGTDHVYWCPMHPQIKSNKENAICPICNMALIELEGGLVEAPEYLTLTAQQIQQAGVVTEAVVRRDLYREIDTTGRIDYDERRYAGIGCWIKGKSRIDKLHVNFTGGKVQKGQTLAEIYSPELITSQQEFLLSLRADRTRRTESRSGTARSAPGLVSRVDSARQRLLYQGITAAQVDQLADEGKVWDRVPILAPIDGTVIERHVQEGQYVNEGDWLFHLADLTHLWLFVDIFEDDFPLIEVGMPVELSVGNRLGETFPGTIAYIEPKVKSDTRTLPVRIDVDNHDGKLLPGMFARARVRHEWPSLLAVPENAVLWSGQRAIVIVKGGEGTFRPREVQLGRKWLFPVESDNVKRTTLGFGDDRVRYQEVLAGLVPGDEVVTSGAFLLNAESQFQNVLAKMLPPESHRATLEQVVGEPLAQRIRSLLGAYFKLSQTLADDQIDQVSARLTQLRDEAQALAEAAADTGADALTADADRFSELTAALARSPLQDARDARTRFGRISHELTKLLAAHGGQTVFGKELYQFECGMAEVGYERWLWWSPEIHNPYMGQKMLKCGKRLDVLEP